MGQSGSGGPAFAAAGLGCEVRFEVADFVTAASLVRNGLGVAFLPESFAASLPDLPTIRVRARS